MILALVRTFFILAISLFAVTKIVPGFHISSMGALVFACLAVGFVNTFIRPILKLVSLPITLLTLGLFALVVNAACLGLAAYLVPGFSIQGFGPAFLGSIILTIVSALLQWLFK